METGSRFCIVGEHEKDSPLSSGKLPIVIRPGYRDDYVWDAHRDRFLRLMDSYAARFSGKRVLDIGTGAGFLAIAAIGLGAIFVVAVDSLNQIASYTKGNFEVNGVADKVTLVSSILGVSKRFDIILCNIDVPDSHKEVVPQMESKLEKDGFVLLQATQPLDSIVALTKLAITVLEEMNSTKLLLLRRV